MWTLVLAVGCSGSDDAPDDGPKGSTSDTQTSDTDDTDDTDVGDKSAFLSGTVVDVTGAAIDVAEIRFCRGIACRNAETDGSGAFSFDAVDVDWHSLEVNAPEGMDGMATSLVPVVFSTDEVRTVDIVLVPLDATTTTLSATASEHTIGSGLYATLDIDDLEPPLFVDPATQVTGVKLDPSQWVPTDGITGTVLAQYYLDPFDHHAATPVPVRADNTYGLADGTDVQVWIGSYEDSQWVDAGTLTALGTELTGSAALPLFSTLLLVQE